jgi:hypothetical protein
MKEIKIATIVIYFVFIPSIVYAHGGEIFLSLASIMSIPLVIMLFMKGPRKLIYSLIILVNFIVAYVIESKQLGSYAFLLTSFAIPYIALIIFISDKLINNRRNRYKLHITSGSTADRD